MIDIVAVYTQTDVSSQCMQHHIQAVLSASSLVCHFCDTHLEEVGELTAQQASSKASKHCVQRRCNKVAENQAQLLQQSGKVSSTADSTLLLGLHWICESWSCQIIDAGICAPCVQLVLCPHKQFEQGRQAWLFFL